jgi:hypothetical protein
MIHKAPFCIETKKIAAALTLVGSSIDKIAVEANCTPSLVRKVLAGTRAGRGVVGAKVLEIAAKQLKDGAPKVAEFVEKVAEGLSR